VAGTQHGFRTPKQVGTIKLDVCYTDLRRVDGLATATVETHGGHQIQVWMDEAHKFMQVYTDDGAPGRPARAGISIEPMTAAPNAFNSGDGLIVVDPDKRTGAAGVYEANSNSRMEPGLASTSVGVPFSSLVRPELSVAT
jgi:aldose 1-epimerase